MCDDKVNFAIDLAVAPPSEENSISVLFVKRSSDPINPKNISKCLDVHTIQGSALDGLYNTLRGVWCPTLLQSPQWNGKLPPRVQQLLTELETTLSASVRKETQSSSSTDIENVSDIIEPIDEINFWLRIKEERRSPLRNLARLVDQSFAEITSPGFSDLDTLDLSVVADVVNRTFDALNGAWTAAPQDGGKYPQRRMEHLLDCIGSALCRYLQRKLATIDVWQSHAGDIRLKLQSAIRICEQWCDIPKKLTSTFWVGGDHPWKGGVHVDTFMLGFKTRLEHVLRIRTLSDELSQLLTVDERRSFQLDKLFIPLEDTKPLQYNPYTEPQWARAVQEYEQAISPVESAVAAHFRRNTAPVLDRPQLLLREFQKYKNLIERPTIRRELVAEREALLSLLRDLVKKMEGSVDRIETGQDDSDTEEPSGRGGKGDTKSAPQGRLLSPSVAGIVFLRQLNHKVASILSTSQGLLNDLDGFSRFSAQCEALMVRIKNEGDSRFDTWKSDVEAKIEEDDPALRLQGSLMGWKDGVLIVNFSEDLVRFLREVRQLDELGYEIPRPSSRRRGIMDKAVEAEKYYRYGILLKKTANFYNSISEQMIDVQEQLLLDSLTAFATIVSKPSQGKSADDVSWSNPAECENYIRTLQDAAEKLSSENRWLRKVHESLCAHTVSIMNIDLLRQTENWKAKWRVIKEKMATVRNKYNEKDSRMWVLHWDHQMYKALEASYQMGLESLNENLPEIKVELVFVNKRLEFKPPMEQIRQSYYHEMRKFVAMPNAFEGFGNTVVYRRMGARNSKRLIQVFIKAEALFEKLMNVVKRYEPLTRLGLVDIDQYVEHNVTRPDEYVANFKALRVKRKDIDRLPDVEKVDCCSVSLTPFKAFLEDLLQKVGDALLVSLRRGLLGEFKEVDQFLEASNERLSSRPHSVEEIGNAKKYWKEIDSKKDSMKALSRACVEKKKLLLQYAPGTAVDVSEVTSRMANLDGEGGRWDDFDIMLEAFNDMVEEQKEALKGSLEEDVVNLNVNIDKFGNRWRQLKPGEVKSWEYADVQRVFESLEDWKKQFNDLQVREYCLQGFPDCSACWTQR